MSSLLPLCAVSSPKHCAMHIALEELFYMDGTDVLVVGTGECAYSVSYTHLRAHETD